MTDKTNDVERIEVKVVVAVNAEHETAAALVEDGDVDEAISGALIEISNGVPLIAYLISLDLPLPGTRVIRARVEPAEGDIQIEVDEA